MLNHSHTSLLPLPIPSFSPQDFTQPFEQLVAQAQSAVCPDPTAYTTGLVDQTLTAWKPTVGALIDRTALLLSHVDSVHHSPLTPAICCPAPNMICNRPPIDY
jgi:hypothetical protein